MMKNSRIPFAAILISLITLAYSMYVSFAINGKWLSDLQLLQLEQYGALRFEHLKNVELWRLFAFQLMHVKYLHMIYNVLSIIALGVCVERFIGVLRFFLLWFVSGVIGTLVGSAFIAPPWNLGTGASQAVLGIAGLGLALVLKRINTSKWLLLALAFSIAPALVLDLIHAGYPKPAHIVSMMIGLVAGLLFVKPGYSKACPR